MADLQLGGLSLRTHWAFIAAQAKTEAVGRWIPVGLLLLLQLATLDGTSTTRAVTTAVLFGVVGGSVSSSTEKALNFLRVFGVSAAAARVQLILTSALRTGVFLLCVIGLWVGALIWGEGAAGWYWLSGLIAVLLAATTFVITSRRLTSDVLSNHKDLSYVARWRGAVDAESGHRKVMERQAAGGVLSTISMFLVLMIPGQLVMVFLGLDAGLMVTMIVTGLIATTVFVRVIQAEAAAQLWLVFGGKARDWRQAVVARMWQVPAAFVIIYVIAALISELMPGEGAEEMTELLVPDTLGDWVATVVGAACLGVITQAAAAHILSVTVTNTGQFRSIRAGAVYAVGICMIGAGGIILVADADMRWTVTGIVVSLLYAAVAALLFNRRSMRAELCATGNTESWFGLGATEKAS